MKPTHCSISAECPPLAVRLSPHRNRRGSTILTALIVTAVITVIIGASLLATNGAARIANRATTYITAERAADGAVEYGFGIWKQRIFENNGAISTTTANANITAPVFPGFAYDTVANDGPLNLTATDAYGTPSASPIASVVSLSNYPGWQGYSYNYLVSAKVASTNQLGSVVKAGVRRRFQYVEVPIFQMMYFFNDNLEFYNPATMTVGGLVQCNSNMYASQESGLTFTGNVSYSGSYSSTTAPPYSSSYKAWSSSDQPPTLQGSLTMVPVAQPLGLSLSALFTPGGPNPNTQGYQEIIQQPVAGYTDPPEISERRMVNKAGIEMVINGTTATVTAQNGTVATTAQLNAVKAAFTGKKTGTTASTGFYDQRQGSWVNVSTIDVSVLTPALNAIGAANFNSVIYIVDNTAATTGNSNPTAIRLINGGVLPTAGLTVASQNPVYIQGDYNTGATSTASYTTVPSNATGNPNDTSSPNLSTYTRVPSAVMGDAVMFLSNAWNDANSSLALTSRNAVNTTINTAVMGGFMPSGYTNSSGVQYGYSGGANNYPRFLENWTGTTCTYTGSMVELFPSQIFTAQWALGNVYTPPTRRWNFDTNFLTSAPPGSLICVVYCRGSWSKF